MTPEQEKALRLIEIEAQARLRLENEQSLGSGSEARNGAWEGWGQALWHGPDQALENIGQTASALGFEETGQGLSDLMEGTEGYESASGKFMDGEGLFGFDWSYAPKATIEQAGQFAGSLVARAGGAAAGGAVGGPFGAVAGGLAGPAAFEVAQQLGPVALERAKNNGRDKPNREDWAAAIATSGVSGALNAAAPGMSGVVRRAGVEGLTEGAQSVVEQTGSTAGTESGLDVDLHQAFGEGILGSTSSGAISGVEGTFKAGGAAAGSVRTDRTEFSEDDVELSQRLKDQTNGDERILGTVSSTDRNTSAQGAAKGVLAGLREEAKQVVAGLKRDLKDGEIDPSLASIEEELGRLTDEQRKANSNVDQWNYRDPEQMVQTALNKVMRQGTNLKASFADKDIEAVTKLYGDSPDAQRLKSLLNQISKVSEFSDAKGDLGGLNQWTRLIDPLDGRSGIGRMGAAGLHLGAGMGSLGAGLASTGSAIALNRVARGLDNLTNRRSRVKRYVNSVDKAIEKKRLDPQNANERISNLRRLAQEARAKDDTQNTPETSPEASQGFSGPFSQGRPELDTTKYGFHELTAPVIAKGKALPDAPFYDPWRQWEKYTGLKSGEIHQRLTELEQEGLVEKGTANKFRQGARDFWKKGANKEQAYVAQELVRERFNPEHSVRKAELKEKASQAQKEVAYISPTKGGTSTKRSANKGKDAARRFNNVQAQIESGSASLSPKQYRALNELASVIDNYGMNREDRRNTVDETLREVFDNPAEFGHWQKVFEPLASIGNDFRIEYSEEAQKEHTFRESLEKTKKKAKKSTKSSKKVKEPAEPKAPETKADAALRKLKEPTLDQSKEEPVETSPSDKAQEAKEPKLEKSKEGAKEKPKKKARTGKTGMKDRLDSRVKLHEDAVETAELYGEEFSEYVSSLSNTNDRGRVEKIIYEIGSDRVTVNMIAEAYAEQRDVPGDVAIKRVMDALETLKEEGHIKSLFLQGKGGSRLKADEEYKSDSEGNPLHVMTVQFDEDAPLYANLQVAKAIQMVNNSVPQSEPLVPFSPTRQKVGSFNAFKGISEDRADASFAPLYETLNILRRNPLAINQDMLRQLQEATEGDNGHTGVIASVLTPTTKEGVDESPLRTLAQLTFQQGRPGEQGDTTIQQEFMAGANGRIYSKNGMAHSQAGDMMKGLIRTNGRHKVGGMGSLRMMFHSFGNILGQDKKSPKFRRDYLFKDKELIPALLKFAEKPFGQYTLKTSKGNASVIAPYLKEGEGFTQVLGVAHEVKRMVEWAKARHPKKAKKPYDLLSDPSVQQDIADNYDTDWIVQLDASNNAYQLASLVMGYQKGLESTGLSPIDGVNPDETAGKDIYMIPANVVIPRVPELQQLRDGTDQLAALPDSKLRKFFKKPVGTYLYAAAFNSRKKAFADALVDIADGAPVFSLPGQPGLIQMDSGIVEGLRSEGGHVFQLDKYDHDGNITKTENVARKVYPIAKGKYAIATANGKGSFKEGATKFDTEEEAIVEAYSRDFYGRVNRELVRAMETEFSGVRDYLNFANEVAELAKKEGLESIKVPTPDGMLLEYSFKQKDQFEGVEVPYGDGVVRLGYRTDESKTTGRGLAAFMTHQLDAWVLRETHRRLEAEGSLKGFNPIHDSFGFHPSDAERGQAMAVKVMQEINSGDYDLFTAILEANTIDGNKMTRYVTPPRKSNVPSYSVDQIPTAVS